MVDPGAHGDGRADAAWFLLPCDDRTAHRAQHAVARTLLGWDLATFLDVAMRLTYELAANVVAGSSASELRVEVRGEGRDVVRVTFVDSGPSVGESAVAPNGQAAKLLTDLAIVWGAEQHADEQHVWFEIEG